MAHHFHWLSLPLEGIRHFLRDNPEAARHNVTEQVHEYWSIPASAEHTPLSFFLWEQGLLARPTEVREKVRLLVEACPAAVSQGRIIRGGMQSKHKHVETPLADYMLCKQHDPEIVRLLVDTHRGVLTCRSTWRGSLRVNSPVDSALIAVGCHYRDAPEQLLRDNLRKSLHIIMDNAPQSIIMRIPVAEEYLFVANPSTDVLDRFLLRVSFHEGLFTTGIVEQIPEDLSKCAIRRILSNTKQGDFVFVNGSMNEALSFAVLDASLSLVYRFLRDDFAVVLEGR